MNKRAAIYARTSGRDIETESLPDQVALCTKYATDKGYRIVAEYVESDKGVLGADWNAPELLEAISHAEKRLFDVLIVRDIARFARDKTKGAFFEYQFKQVGVDIEYVWQSYDGESGDMVKWIDLMFAEIERKRIRERVVNGLEKWLGRNSAIFYGKPPLGLAVEKADGLFVPRIVDNEAKIVKTIFDLFTIDRLSIRAIAKHLNDTKTPTYSMMKEGKTGGKWNGEGVRRILKNRTYTGEYHHGRKIAQVTVIVPQIISKEQWEAAQKILQENIKAKSGAPSKYPYLVARYAKCECGFAAIRRTKVTSGGKYTYLYYECNRINHRETKPDNCFNRVKAGLLDTFVWQWFELVLSKKGLLEEKLQDIEAEHKKQIEPLYLRQEALTNWIADRQKKIDNLMELILDLGKDAAKRLNEELKSLEDETEKLDQAREEIRADIMSLERDFLRYEYDEDYQKRTEQLISWHGLADLLRQDFAEANIKTFKEKRDFIKRFNLAVTLSKQDGQIFVKIESDIGQYFASIDTVPDGLITVPTKYSLIISDYLILDLRELLAKRSVYNE